MIPFPIIIFLTVFTIGLPHSLGKKDVNIYWNFAVQVNGIPVTVLILDCYIGSVTIHWVVFDLDMFFAIVANIHLNTAIVNDINNF